MPSTSCTGCRSTPSGTGLCSTLHLAGGPRRPRTAVLARHPLPRPCPGFGQCCDVARPAAVAVTTEPGLGEYRTGNVRQRGPPAGRSSEGAKGQVSQRSYQELRTNSAWMDRLDRLVQCSMPTSTTHRTIRGRVESVGGPVESVHPHTPRRPRPIPVSPKRTRRRKAGGLRDRPDDD